MKPEMDKLHTNLTITNQVVTYHLEKLPHHLTSLTVRDLNRLDQTTEQLRQNLAKLLADIFAERQRRTCPP